MISRNHDDRVVPRRCEDVGQSLVGGRHNRFVTSAIPPFDVIWRGTERAMDLPNVQKHEPWLFVATDLVHDLIAPAEERRAVSLAVIRLVEAPQDTGFGNQWTGDFSVGAVAGTSELLGHRGHRRRESVAL